MSDANEMEARLTEPVAFYETEGDEWFIYPRGTSTYEHIRDHQKDRIDVHVFALYTASQLRAHALEATRLAMERAAQLVEMMGPPPFDENEAARRGAKACADAIRSLASAQEG